MSKRFETRRVVYLLLAAVAFFVMAVIGWYCVVPRCAVSLTHSLPDVPKERQVLLCSRRVILPTRRSFPVTFPSSQVSTPRHTLPFILVCAERVNAHLRRQVTETGARVHGFLPENALLIEATQDQLVALQRNPSFHAAVEFLPADKLPPSFAHRVETEPDTVSELTVVAFAKEYLADLTKLIESLSGEITAVINESRDALVRARIPLRRVKDLIRYGIVHWVEEFVQPHVFNDAAVRPGLLDVAPVWNLHGLTGRGQVVALADSGLDTGNINTLHRDLRGRICKILHYSQQGYSHTADLNGHGTHVAGSIAGGGDLSAGLYRGTAQEATLYVQATGADDGSDSTIALTTEYLYKGYYQRIGWRQVWDVDTYGWRIHSDSWGSTDNAVYNSSSRQIDSFLYGNPTMLSVFAAGNSGPSKSTLSAEAVAKNVLSVGASQSSRSGYTYTSFTANTNTVASFSSRGPCGDGRIKPDVIAPGTYIISTRSYQQSAAANYHRIASNTNYAFLAGTSMATPLTSGCAALVRQWLTERRGHSDPSAALVKAVLTGGTRDITGTAPDMNEGWGLVDLGETLYPTDGRAVRLEDWISIAQGGSVSYSITTTDTAPFDVQLVWIDEPALLSAAKQLVNDLDLSVRRTSDNAIWLGNGGETADELNNVESVRIPNAPAGTYVVKIDGSKLVSDYSGNVKTAGAVALYIRGAFANTEPSYPTHIVTVASDFQPPDADTQYATSSPELGSHTYASNAVVWFTAADYLYRKSGSDQLARHAFTGYTGSGSVDSAGTTNAVRVRVEGDSSIQWHWTATPTDYSLIRRRWLYPNMRMSGSSSEWHVAGTTLSLSIPESIQGQSESLTYINSPFTLGGWRIGPSTNELRSVTMPDGRIAQSCDVTMTNGVYAYFDFYRNNMTTNGVPAWWFARYLAENTENAANDDPDGDGHSNQEEYLAGTIPIETESSLRILAYGVTNLTWQGGSSRTQLVERADTLGANANWTAIYTNLPPTPITNTVELAPTAPRSFYRIRIPPL
ncbi:MAG: S8 family serine peptidase [Kiritimatiellae bacterium]|nr:S8 family serine peptidase [Kiritimatiellia bacterium]